MKITSSSPTGRTSPNNAPYKLNVNKLIANRLSLPIHFASVNLPTKYYVDQTSTRPLAAEFNYDVTYTVNLVSSDLISQSFVFGDPICKAENKDACQ